MDMPLRIKCEGEGEDTNIREAHTIETEENEERNVLCERGREREDGDFCTGHLWFGSVRTTCPLSENLFRNPAANTQGGDDRYSTWVHARGTHEVHS